MPRMPADALLAKTTQVTSGALSYTTNFSNRWRLVSVTVRWNTAPTTSGNLTITTDDTAGSAYDTVLYSQDPSSTSATSVSFIPEGDLLFEKNTEIVIAHSNTDNRTISVNVRGEVF